MQQFCNNFVGPLWMLKPPTFPDKTKHRGHDLSVLKKVTRCPTLCGTARHFYSLSHVPHIETTPQQTLF